MHSPTKSFTARLAVVSLPSPPALLPAPPPHPRIRLPDELRRLIPLAKGVNRTAQLLKALPLLQASMLCRDGPVKPVVRSLKLLKQPPLAPHPPGPWQTSGLATLELFRALTASRLP